jgi:hypothetical protein
MPCHWRGWGVTLVPLVISFPMGWLWFWPPGLSQVPPGPSGDSSGLWAQQLPPDPWLEQQVPFQFFQICLP